MHMMPPAMAAVSTKRRERSAWGRIAARSGTGAIIVAVLVAIWEVVTHALQIAPSTLPSPSRLLLEVWRQGPQLAKHAWVTGVTAAEGLVPAAAAALGLSTLTCISPVARRIAEPMIRLAEKMPLISMAPLAVLWFGFGARPVAALSFAVSLVLLIPHLQAGFDSMPGEVFDYLTSIRAPAPLIFWKVRMPACLPYLIRALKTTVPFTLAAAAAAEWIGADQGLGYLMLYAGSHADSLQLFAALAVLFLMAWAGCLALLVVEEIWGRWPSQSAGRSAAI